MLRRTYFDTPMEKGCFDLVWSLNWIGGMACLKFWGPKILWRRFFHQPYKGWDQTNSKRYNSQQQDCISHHWANTSPITTIVILTWFGVAMKTNMVWSGNSTSRSISHQFAAFSQLFRTFFLGFFFLRWVFFGFPPHQTWTRCKTGWWCDVHLPKAAWSWPGSSAGSVLQKGMSWYLFVSIYIKEICFIPDIVI